MNEIQSSGLRSFLCIVLLFAFVAGLRIGAPSDLHEGDQPKQMDYVLDIVCNGNWTVQHHADGSIMSKPPLYNWLAAPAVMLFGPEDVWLKWPSLMAGLATLLMCWDMVRRRLGERAALCGCVFMLLTSMFAKQMYYARTDMLLTCFSVMQFWAVLRWEDEGGEAESFRSGWVWTFWIAAALGNLSKGPLALLPHVALSTCWLLEGRFKDRYSRLGVWWGLPLALAPLAVWFAMGCRVEGWSVMYGHLVRGEMLDRFKPVAAKTVADNTNRSPFYYLPQLIGRTLPWSLFGLVGLWGVFTAKLKTSLTDKERATLRILAAWFFGFLIFWSAVPSKRVDRIFPAVPAFCLLAGWAVDGFLKSLKNQESETSGHVRYMNRAVGWSAMFVAALAIVASVGLIMLSTGAKLGPLDKVVRKNLSSATLATLLTEQTMVLISSVLMACAGAVAIGAYFKKRGVAMACALVAVNMGAVVLYQSVLGNWTQTEFFTHGNARVCREVRQRAKAEGAEILVLAGSGPNARFYLLQAGLQIPPKDAAARLAKPHGPVFVAGLQPYHDGKRRQPGGLEEAGLGEEKTVPVTGVPDVRNGAVLPALKWLGAVFVPAK